MNQAEHNANLPTKYKVRIHTKYVILERLEVTQTSMERDPNTGLVVPISKEYDQHEGPELAINFNYLKVSKDEFEKEWKALGNALWFKMNQGGITR